MKEKVKTLLAEAFNFTEEQKQGFQEENYGDSIEVSHPDIYHNIGVPTKSTMYWSIGHYNFIPGTQYHKDGSGTPDEYNYEEDEWQPHETPIEKIVSRLVELEKKYNEEMEQLCKEEEAMRGYEDEQTHF